MMKHKSLIFFYLFLITTNCIQSQVLPSFGDSRAGTAGLQFLKIAPDARSSALAGSYAAIVDDVSAMYWNPAGLTHMDSGKYHFQFSHASYVADVGLNFAGFAFSNNGYNFWGINLVSMNSGEMPVTTEFQPYGTGQTFSVSNILVGLSFAKVLSNNFSFGLSGKYVYENIADVTIQNGLIDFGFIYNVGIKTNTRFSVGISNFGFNVSPQGKVTLNTLNGTKEVDQFEQVAAPSIFRLGVATDLVKKEDHSLLIAAQLNHPTDNKESLALGLEYGFKRVLFLRSGYELGADYTTWPAFGFGLNLRRYFGQLKVDYSFNNKDYLGNIHRITLAMDLINLKQK
jgi:hypothetical protein